MKKNLKCREFSWRFDHLNFIVHRLEDDTLRFRVDNSRFSITKYIHPHIWYKALESNILRKYAADIYNKSANEKYARALTFWGEARAGNFTI